MKISLRKYRLVLACINWSGALIRLVAAIVNMASNYSRNDPEVAIAL